MDIECGGFTFISNFDSSNIDRVELVPSAENDDSEEKTIPLYEFNIWTKTDCAGTEFENSNRSWFYFGVKGGTPCTDVKLNVVNLNKQGKLYNQGMAPVYKITPGPNRWERVRDPLSFDMKQNLLSFGYRTLENLCTTTYFAFTYPYSFIDLQSSLKQYDLHIKKLSISSNCTEANPDDIYYHRECLVKSLEGRPVDLITISSHHNITSVREPRLKGLFPESNTPRAYQFKGKKVIFLSARVHPGETPSSFVMNGVLQLLLNKNDSTAITLRKMYVFKLVPMLNPDGVSRGYYRTDTRGANLNRFYLNPSEELHPSVFAARSLILYYHYGYEKEMSIDDCTVCEDSNACASVSSPQPSETQNHTGVGDTEASSFAASEVTEVSEGTSNPSIVSDTEELNDKVAEISVDECDEKNVLPEAESTEDVKSDKCSTCAVGTTKVLPVLSSNTPNECCSRKKFHKVRQLSRFKLESAKKAHDSGLYLYIDIHGHASKKGIFMYGNHFDNITDKVECLLLPKLLSINNPHFHYNQCNFSKRNMYTRDRRDGLSKEGCGRVAVLKYTGLVRSYTLECNYNTGCIVNIIPPTQRPLGKHLVQPIVVPPKYTPQIYEEVGRGLCVSILDMTGSNPNSRLPSSQYKSINGLKESLKGEAIVAKNVQAQQNLKMRQGFSLLQRGNKNAGLNYTTATRKLLSLKRQSKAAMFGEMSSSQSTAVELKETPAPRTALHHRLNKCNVPLAKTAAIGTLKHKRRKTKLVSDVQKKLTLKKKLLGNYGKIDDELWQSKGEPSNWNANKRKIEKKLSPNGNANTSARPPNKKRKKSKIL